MSIVQLDKVRESRNEKDVQALLAMVSGRQTIHIKDNPILRQKFYDERTDPYDLERDVKFIERFGHLYGTLGWLKKQQGLDLVFCNIPKDSILDAMQIAQELATNLSRGPDYDLITGEVNEERFSIWGKYK